MTFSKTTPNGKITLYVPKREFIDYLSWIQPIDGAVVVDQDYNHPDRSIAVQLISSIRYGREDDEVMGLNLSRELCMGSLLVNKSPPPKQLTQLQEDLVKMHGDACFPFRLEWPRNVGASLFIQQPAEAKGKPCGMEHYLEVFCLYRGGSKPHKRSSMRFDVDVVQMHGSAEKSAVWVPPVVSVSRSLMFSPGRIYLEVNLEKTCITDGEPLLVYVTINNHSNKSITKMKTSLLQFYKLSFSEGFRKVPVQCLETAQGFPVVPGGTLNMTMMLVPHMEPKHKGLALRSVLNSSRSLVLASSTLFGADLDQDDFFGFIISYRVRVKLSVAMSPLKGSIVAQVPVFVVAGNGCQKSVIIPPQPKVCRSTDVEATGIFRNRRSRMITKDIGRSSSSSSMTAL